MNADDKNCCGNDEEMLFSAFLLPQNELLGLILPNRPNAGSKYVNKSKCRRNSDTESEQRDNHLCIFSVVVVSNRSLEKNISYARKMLSLIFSCGVCQASAWGLPESQIAS